MQALKSLSQNVQLLLERYETLQQENATLREENERQRDELIRTHSDLQQLQMQYRRLGTVNALTTIESKDLALKRVNALIAQVDRVIKALNGDKG